MKKLLVLVFLLLTLCASAQATQITISSFAPGLSWRYGGTSAQLRISNSQGFLDSDGTWIPASTSTNFYKTVTCTIASTTITCPSFTLSSTTNGNPTSSRYKFQFYGPGTANTPRDVLFSNYQVPVVLGTTITIAQLVTFNQATPTPPRPGFPDTQQVQALINAVLPAPKATTAVEGIGRISTTPVDPVHPIFVSDNDSRVPTQAENDALVGTSGTPSSSNEYVTRNDTATSGTSKVLRLDSSGRLPALDGSQLTNLPTNDTLGWLDAVLDCRMDKTGVIDGSALLQACLNTIGAGSQNATIYFPAGTYLIAGALQDTGASNAQIVLPKRTTTQLSIRFLGAVPPSILNASAGGSGVTIKSTLASGTGAMIGVKGTGSANATTLNFEFDSITFQTVANPTITALDLRYLKRAFGTHFKIWDGETGIPTEPTTATSYGLRPPLNNIVSDSGFSDGVVSGFYNGVEMSEISTFHNVTAVLNRNGWVIPENVHQTSPSHVLAIWNAHQFEFAGANSTVEITADIERTNAVAWYTTACDVCDSNNYAHGTLGWHAIDVNVSTPSATLTQTGAFYLWTPQLYGGTSTSTPFVQGFRSTNQSFTDATITRVLFDTNLGADPYSIHSTSSNTDRFICPKQGVVHITFSAEFAANATGVRQLHLYKFSGFDSSTNLVGKTSMGGFAGDPSAMFIGFQGTCSVPGDYFFAQAYQSSGGALNLSTVNYGSPIFTFHLTR